MTTGRPRAASSLMAASTVGFLVVAAVFLAVGVQREWGGWTALRAEMAGYDWAPSAAPLVFALLLGAGALVLTAFVWARLHRAMGGRIPPRQGAAAWLFSNLGRYIPGKVWQIAGLAGFLRFREDSAATGISSSIAIQAMTLLTGGAVGATLLAGRLGGGSLPLRALLFALALGALAHPRAVELVARLTARLMGEPPPRRPSGREFAAGVATLLVVWALYGLGFHALLEGLVEVQPLGPIEAAGVFATSYVAGYLVLISPGGLVVREGAMAALLSSIGGYPLGVAAALAIAARLWAMAGEVIAAILTGALGRRPPGAHGPPTRVE